MNQNKNPYLGDEPIFMGVLNLTPNSFSDGGRFMDLVDAQQQVSHLISSGARIIDIGAESTGPGSAPVGAEEEIGRLKNVFALNELERVEISIDTYRAETADYCLQRGAKIVNDVSALRADSKMAEVAAKHKAWVVLMYSKQGGEHPNVETESRQYLDVIKTIGDFLEERINHACEAGIASDKIILDPGMGAFVSSDPKYSWEILNRLNELRERFMKFPILIGTSRKSFLGGTLEERDPISQLTALAGFNRGANIIRTHNVEMAREFHRAWNLLNL